MISQVIKLTIFCWTSIGCSTFQLLAPDTTKRAMSGLRLGQNLWTCWEQLGKRKINQQLVQEFHLNDGAFEWKCQFDLLLPSKYLKMLGKRSLQLRSFFYLITAWIHYKGTDSSPHHWQSKNGCCLRHLFIVAKLENVAPVTNIASVRHARFLYSDIASWGGIGVIGKLLVSV